MQKQKSIYRFLDMLSIVIFVATIAVLIVFWKKIPDTIPTHYNGAGNPDAYGYKSSLILLIFAEVFTLGSTLFAVVLVKMTTKSNSATVSEKAITNTISPMLSVLNLILVAMFSYLIYCSAACIALSGFFLPIMLIATFLPIIWYLVKYYKMTGQNPRKEQKAFKSLDESSPIQSYRTKVDWWIGGLLIICCILPLWLIVVEFMEEAHINIWMLILEVFLLVLLAPLFFMKYIMYETHLKVQCGIYGSYRIPYNTITSIKKTLNPLSSAAMSIKRIQIDYSKNGSPGMILISPVHRDEFIKVLKEKCNMN